MDVIEILTKTDRPRKYWSDLKVKLQKEGSELSEKIGQLKFLKLKNQKVFSQNKVVAHDGGSVAGNARKEIETKTGKKVITNKNAKKLRQLK